MKSITSAWISSIHGNQIIREKIVKIAQKKKIHMAIDSNIFRNQNFINFLELKKSFIQIYLPTIVQIEVGYYYRTREFNWDEYFNDITDFDGIFLHLSDLPIIKIIENAYINKNKLPFRDHFRDFLIGIECEEYGLGLITYNINHFTWIKDINIQTPETFVKEMNSLSDIS